MRERGQGSTVKTIPTDIFDTPIALVRHESFALEPGSFERIKHTVQADLYFGAATPGVAEKAMLPLVSACIATFRTNVGLGLAGITHAVIRRGGPPRDEDVNQKPFSVYPLTIEVLEAGPATYSL